MRYPAARTTWPQVAVVVLGLLFVAASCTSSDGGDAAENAADVGAGGEPTEGEGGGGSDGPDGDGSAGAADDGSDDDAAPVPDGPPLHPESIGLVPRVRLPVVPPIALPDLSELGGNGDELAEQLAGLAGPTAGVDLIGVACVDLGGELVYQGRSGDSFFDLAADGSGVFRDVEGGNDLEIRVEADGSGTYRDLGGGRDVEIVVAADGSGTYREDRGTSTLEIQVAADGSGTYRDRGNDIDVEIIVAGDGSGSFRDASFSNDLEVRVESDGSGSFRNFGANNEAMIDWAADGSWSFRDLSHNQDVELVVNADGSGSLVDRSGAKDLSVVVDADGNGTMIDVFLDFAADIADAEGILDADLLAVGPIPVFAVADRFPPLDSLGRLEPPCATVVRLGADVLFDFDSDELRPEVAPIVDRLALALVATDQIVEIHGHTDAVGDEAYNQDLAARRAAAFAAALVERGVSAELRIVSFGETRPVAPNERADGSDDPLGRQLNRRIEIVVPET